MSHFVVMVFGDNHEKALDPFWELDLSQKDAAVDPRATFEDHTDEVLKDWNENTEKRILVDGVYLSKYNKRFRKQSVGLISGDEYIVPDGCTLESIPVNKLYNSIGHYAKKWHGYDRHVVEDGSVRYGYWNNPNAKWDWYQVGGRWNGYFKVKEGVACLVGEGGPMTTKPRPGYADQCRIKDIDFEGLYADAMKEAMETYDKFEKATEGIEIPPTWDIIRKELFPNDIDGARAYHNNTPWTKAMRDARLDSMTGCTLSWYFVGNGGRDAFVENSKCRALLPFAVLLDGKWYEKGSMGWWGMVADEKTQYDWATKFTELWETLDPETVVTIVDCHI